MVSVYLFSTRKRSRDNLNDERHILSFGSEVPAQNRKITLKKKCKGPIRLGKNRKEMRKCFKCGKYGKERLTKKLSIKENSTKLEKIFRGIQQQNYFTFIFPKMRSLRKP